MGVDTGAFAPYNRQIHGDAKFSLLAAVAAKGDAMEDDSNNNGCVGTYAFARNNWPIHGNGKFGSVGMDHDSDDDGSSVGAFAEDNPQILAGASFSLLAAIAAKGLVGYDDDVYSSDDDHDGTLSRCASPVQDIDDNIEDICRNDESNEHLINAILGENADGNCEFFTNGLGINMISCGRHHRGVLETRKRKASFLSNWSGPSAILRALPFIWQRRRNGRVHYFADVFLVVLIIANTLGFGSASAYVKCRGWTCHKNDGVISLQYRKLEHVFDKYAPNGEAALLSKHLHAMVNEIYSVLDDNLFKHIYTGGPAIRFLTKESFISKLNQYAQDFQIGLIVIMSFFMAVTPDHRDDPEYWMKKIFASCHT